MNFLNRLWRYAHKSPCRYRIAAMAISHKGEIIAMATNKQRFMTTGGGIHAEINVLRKCKAEGIAKLFLVRIGAGGAVRPIKPCQRCQKLLNKLNITVVSMEPSNDPNSSKSKRLSNRVGTPR
jgi:cytidine deaminase